MHSVQKIACQISFYPLGEKNYNEIIARALEVIEDSGLDATVGDMSTIIRGDADKVFSLLHKITQVQDQERLKYTMNLTVSNTCGCE